MGNDLQGFGMMIDKLRKNPKKIVFTEGTAGRILEATSVTISAVQSSLTLRITIEWMRW